ncbi:MAG: DUF5689 domain-containing protein [Ferruginibacter sp.]
MQKNKTLSWIGSMIVILAAFVGISSCNKEFDAPPGPADQPIPAGYTQISVKDLKARHTTTGTYELIGDKVALSVVVSANDKSGNLYKQIFVQDETGGIQLLLDMAGLYGPYPVGRKLWVKCDGLYLSDDGGVMVLGIKTVLNGVPQMGGIEPQRIREYLIGGSINNPVTPKIVNYDDLGFDLQDENIGRLIQVEGYQFNYPATTYSDTSNYKRTVNLGIKNCDGDTLIVRNSAYASFAGVSLPNGNGNLTAIYTVFTATSRPARQLLIRDTSDVQFTQFRCGSGPTELLPTADLRALFTGTTTTVPSGKRITGVVISDRTTANINSRNIVLQQGTGLAGVLVRFSADHAFNLGDTIDVNVSGQELSEFNGLLQVNNVAPDAAIKLGEGRSITPREATVAEINTNFEAWESTLIKIKGATVSSGTWGGNFGNTNVTQSANTIVIYTLAAATFAGETKPTGSVDIVAYTGQGGTAKTKQLSLRSSTDVTGGGGPVDPATLMNIADVRALYTGTTTTAPASRKISGIVISDKSTNNINTRNLVIQQGNGLAGILVRFDGDHTFNLGDEIEVVISGVELSEFNGLLQLNNVPLANATLISTGKSITPRAATVADINTNFETWESTLVKITAAELSPAGTWSGNTTVTQSGNTIVLFTAAAASFAGTTKPTGSVDVVAYLSQGGSTSTQQLSLRSTTDVTGGGVVEPPTGDKEDFETGTKNGYTDGTAALATGEWFMADAGTFGETNDIKTGTKSARLRGTNAKEGYIQTNFDVTGLKTVKLNFAGTNFSEGTDTDKEISVELKYSKDGGATWTSAGKKTNGVRGTFTAVSWDINAAAAENVRIQIINTSFLRSTNNRVRINVDDVEFIK